ncbi:hypothetical protein E3P92_01593 [Wallemia ichthyophaga]|uniref:AB hydrolase-1 domain-containing protein n=1 Tax=Wallemia ichthyophaga TaxID=245174 RepID=A0A4T0KQA6_WALIC|nr:hypothetical protein E3P97_01920 [Wallemia ichthyophaga]TIB07179.1 hypothetical protein E3P93_03974 [Wallemia ichthyophaga]TIB07679.1 hypothetical protein E3P90_03971 [Wallemia ichthyophaga]TIB15469.1 hypothetical protein E3P92_01593 [Wallemia ichthyophaga]TIB19450.1 hypothetical protein E3P89_03958 [Wallemia ichthyophaga]
MPEHLTTLKDNSTVAYNVFNEDATDKIALVLIMGMTGCMLDWQMWAEAVAKAGNRKVVIFDNRNIGNSHGNIDGLSVDSMALDTIELIEQLNLKDVHLLGFSMGGIIAQQMLLNHSPLFTIHKIILSSSACRRPKLSHIDMSSLEGAQAFNLILYDEEWVSNNKAILAVIKEASNYMRRPFETLQAQFKALSAMELGEKLKHTDWTNRLYVMHGKRDAIISFKEAEHTLEIAKGAKLVNTLPTLEYGHLFWAYFDPKIWSDAIEGCLGEKTEAKLLIDVMTEQRVTLSDRSELAYNVFNDSANKVPLVMIHGMTGIKNDWTGTAVEMARMANRTIVTPDNRNMGNSKGDVKGMTIDVMANDMIELVERLGYETVNLLGFSMGGMIAQYILFNTTRKFHVNKVILAASSIRFPPTKVLPNSIETFQSFVAAGFDPEWRDNHPNELNEFLESFNHPQRPLETMQAQARAIGGQDTTEKLKIGDWTDLIYVLHGKRDELLTFALAEHALLTVKGSKLINLHSLEFGHFFIMYFMPKDWSDGVEECLGE